MENGDKVSIETRAGAEGKVGKGEGKASGSSRRRRNDIEGGMKARMGESKVGWKASEKRMKEQTPRMRSNTT